MVDQEANKKQGMLRRLFGFIGTVVNGIRTLIGVVFIGFLLLMLTGLFADDIQPMPDSGALYLAPSGVLLTKKPLSIHLARYSLKLASRTVKPWLGILLKPLMPLLAIAVLPIWC